MNKILEQMLAKYQTENIEENNRIFLIFDENKSDVK